MAMELVCNGRTDDATWEDVEAVLEDLRTEQTFFRLTILPKPEIGPRSLEIQGENGYYMPGMSGSEGTGRGLYDPAKGSEKIDIFGDYWEAFALTQDFDLIVRMIKAFYHTGTVPDELWKTPE